MAEEIYKQRVFRLHYSEEWKEYSTSEWNGRDSDELCDYNKVTKTKVSRYVIVEELDLTPYQKSLEDRKRALEQIVKENPELYIDKDSIKVRIEDNTPILKKVEIEVDEAVDFGWQQEVYIMVHKGIRGQYVSGMAAQGFLRFDTPVTGIEASEKEAYKQSFYTVQELLEEEGVLDERYEL